MSHWQQLCTLSQLTSHVVSIYIHAPLGDFWFPVEQPRLNHYPKTQTNGVFRSVFTASSIKKLIQFEPLVALLHLCHDRRAAMRRRHRTEHVSVTRQRHKKCILWHHRWEVGPRTASITAHFALIGKQTRNTKMQRNNVQHSWANSAAAAGAHPWC